MDNTIRTDRRFAIIDEWVLNLDISDRALRLYAILMRYADNETHKAFPSRRTLAERLRCSPASVDRAISELVQAGALSKEQRFNSSLIFTIHTYPNEVGPPVTRGVITDDEGGSSPVMRGVVSGDDLTRTTELEPKNENHLTISADKSAKTNRPHRLPEDWYPSQRLLDMFPEKWPSLDPEYEIENFINYWLGEGKPKADWDRTFQGWMSRNEKQSKPRGGAGYRKPTAAERTAQLIHGARAKDEEELITKGIGQGPDFGHMLKGIEG